MMVPEVDPSEVTCLLDAVDNPGEAPFSPEARERLAAFSAELAALGGADLFPEAPPIEADGCLVEAAVNDALAETYAAARALLVARLNDITLADLAADFSRRMAAHPQRDRLHAHHGKA